MGLCVCVCVCVCVWLFNVFKFNHPCGEQKIIHQNEKFDEVFPQEFCSRHGRKASEKAFRLKLKLSNNKLHDEYVRTETEPRTPVWK